MNKMRLYVFLFSIILYSSSCGVVEALEVRYFDRVEVSGVDLSNWDILTGPDLRLSYGINNFDFETEVLTDVGNNAAPVEWVFPANLEITNDNWLFKVVDEDDLTSDDVLIDTRFFGRYKTDEGNPFTLSNGNITLQVYWKNR